MAEISSNFIQTVNALTVLYLVSEKDINFEQTSLGGLLTFGESSMDSQFDITKSLGGLLKFASQEMNSVFLKTANGDILWVQVDSNGIPESWTEITSTGSGSWTEIDANTSVETWTNKVV